MKVLILRSRRLPDSAPPDAYAQEFDTAFAERVIANLVGTDDFCSSCGPDCVNCRQGYDRKFSSDIAAVSVTALTTRAHENQSLPITGPESLSFPEITARIAAAIGRNLTFVPISDDEARQRYSRVPGPSQARRTEWQTRRLAHPSRPPASASRTSTH